MHKNGVLSAHCFMTRCLCWRLQVDQEIHSSHYDCFIVNFCIKDKSSFLNSLHCTMTLNKNPLGTQKHLYWTHCCTLTTWLWTLLTWNNICSWTYSLWLNHWTFVCFNMAFVEIDSTSVFNAFLHYASLWPPLTWWENLLSSNRLLQFYHQAVCLCWWYTKYLNPQLYSDFFTEALGVMDKLSFFSSLLNYIHYMAWFKKFLSWTHCCTVMALLLSLLLRWNLLSSTHVVLRSQYTIALDQKKLFLAPKAAISLLHYDTYWDNGMFLNSLLNYDGIIASSLLRWNLLSSTHFCNMMASLLRPLLRCLLSSIHYRTMTTRHYVPADEVNILWHYDCFIVMLDEMENLLSSIHCCTMMAYCDPCWCRGIFSLKLIAVLWWLRCDYC